MRKKKKKIPTQIKKKKKNNNKYSSVETPDKSCLRKVSDLLVTRHPLLRTTFHFDESLYLEPYQEVHGVCAGDYDEIEAGVCTEERFAELVAAEAARPFDLTRGPMLRMRVVVRDTTPAPTPEVPRPAKRVTDYLLVVASGIACDTTSMGCILDDLRVLYSDPHGGVDSLPKLKVDYASYAAWQTSAAAGAEVEGMLAQVQKQLNGAGGPAPALSLPVDLPRPGVMGCVGAVHNFTVPKSMARMLGLVGASVGSGLDLVMLSAFEVLLHRISSQPEVLVAVSVPGRGSSDLASVVGPFENRVVHRSSSVGNPDFKTFLERGRAALSNAVALQDVPFPLLVRKLEIEPDPARPPLAQALFEFPRSSGRLPSDALAGFALDLAGLHARLGGLDLTSFAPPMRATRHDLSLMCMEVGGSIMCRLLYNKEVILPATAERWAGILLRLLEGIVDNATQKLSQLPLISLQERAQLIWDWNETDAPAPEGGDRCCHDLVLERARAHPQLPALVDEAGHSFTYAELDARSASIASQLRERCGPAALGEGDFVALLLHRSALIPLAELAIMRTGAAYLPIDPAYPTQRISHMLSDSKARAIITSKALLNQVPTDGTAGTVLIIEDLMMIKASSPSPAPQPQTAHSPSSLAYVIYTSGSTGVPKGVMIEHRTLHNYIRWHSGFCGMKPGSVATQTAGPAFDASVLEIWPALASGCCVHVVSDDTRLTPRKLVKYLVDNAVESCFLPTPLAEAIMLEAWPAGAKLRTLMLGGDQLHRVPTTPLPFKIANLYGPTETTIVATCFSPVLGGVDNPPIGRPIANVKCYVLDENLQVCPVGVIGELYVGGKTLARGYLHRDELTAERFVPDPFSNDPEAPRMYRTGDMCRLLPDGNLVFCARADSQLKIRGFRIELGEIEAALLSHPAVREACVIAREDIPGHKRLVAYATLREDAIVLQDDGSPNVHLPGEITVFIGAKLPSYMLPSCLIVLDRLPLTPNGKLDRKALPSPEHALAEGRLTSDSGRKGGDEHAPAAAASTSTTTTTNTTTSPGGFQSETERVVHGLFRELLGPQATFTMTSDLFDVGGHSLMAMQLVSRVVALFGVDFTLSHLYGAPSVVGVSKSVDLLGASAVTAGSAPTEVLEAVDAAPEDPAAVAQSAAENVCALSVGQRSLWFLSEMSVMGSVSYNINLAFRLRRGDPARFEAALRAAVAHHPALRTVYEGVQGKPVQKLLTANNSYLDLARVPGPLDADAEQRLCRELAHQPFDLAAGPVVRVRLLPSGLVFFSCHHICIDLWSLLVLLEDVGKLYDQPSAVLPTTHSYRQYAQWQARVLESERGERMFAFWKQYLAGANLVLDLPTEFSRPHSQSYRGAGHSFSVPADVCASLHALGKKEGTSPFTVFMAAFQTILSRYSRQEDFVVGTPAAGRTMSQFERTVGYFVNSVAVRANLSGNPTFRELLSRVHRDVITTLENQDMPFSTLVERLAPRRDTSRSPIFQVMMAYQRAHEATGAAGPSDSAAFAMGQTGAGSCFGSGLELEAVEVEQKFSQFDLSLAVAERADGSAFARLQYSTDLFSPQFAADFCEQLVVLLRGCLAAPDAEVRAVSLLPKRERDRLVYQWNETHQSYDKLACAHHLFERQAERVPGALAIEMGRIRYTYAELNARANRLARHLRTLGVGPEVLVGLHQHRGVDAIVSILGILKAGGAYVPLDPSYPASRLLMVIEDCAMPVILSQKSLIADLGPLDPAQVSVFLMDEDWRKLEGGADPANPDHAAVAVGPSNLAYIIFTSGTTGRPKGVMIEHYNVVVHARYIEEFFGVTETARHTQFARLSFDSSVAEIWGAFSTGASLHVVDEDTRLNPEAVRDYFCEHRITHAWVPTSMAALLLQMGKDWSALAASGKLHMHTLYCGGERLPACPDQQLPFRFINTYGPTEDTVMSSCAIIEAVEPGKGHEHPPTIGRPALNHTCYIVDELFNPVPVGVAGELIVSGLGLARGYMKRPEVTAKVFVPNPFFEAAVADPAARRTPATALCYRTGDLCHFQRDGNIAFMGRMEECSMVKIRGFRIELTEIETVLMDHPNVFAAVAVTRKDIGSDGEQRVVAYIVPAPGAHVTVLQLRDYLKAVLPDYMVPAAFVILHELPLNPNGKVNRKALPAPDDDSVVRADFIAPRTPLETVVSHTVALLLGLERVGIHDNLFDIGLHSLSATQLVSRLKQELSVPLKLAAVFDHPTVATLAESIEILRMAAGMAPLPSSSSSSNNNNNNNNNNNATASTVNLLAAATGSATNNNASNVADDAAALGTSMSRSRTTSSAGLGLTPASGSALDKSAVSRVAPRLVSQRSFSYSANAAKMLLSRPPLSATSGGAMGGAATTRSALSDHDSGSNPGSPFVTSAGEGAQLPGSLRLRHVHETRQQLSYNQRSLWFIAQTDPSNVTYHTVNAVRFAGHIDETLMRSAVRATVLTNASLRTTYAVADGVPSQILWPETDVDRFVDVGLAHGIDGEAEILAEMERQAHVPFDLVAGPVLRVRIYPVKATGKTTVLIVGHHIAMDGWSVDLLTHQIKINYYLSMAAGDDALVRRLAACRGNTDVDYLDFARYQHELLTGAGADELWSFWQRQLAGVNGVLALPVDFRRPAVQTYAGATHAFTIPASMRARAMRFLKGETRVTAFSLFMAVFHAFLYRVTSQDDICVGTPAACRNLVEVERVIGNFVNPVVVRSSVGPKMTFRQLLRSVHETVMAVLDHQDYPFPLIVEKLAKHRDTSRSPIFQVLLALQDLGSTTEDALCGPGGGLAGIVGPGNYLATEKVEVKQHNSPFDMHLELFTLPDGSVSGSLVYNTDLILPGTAARFASHYVTLLESALDQPDALVDDLPIMPPAELDTILTAWNSTQAPHRHELVDEVVFGFQGSDAVAVTSKEGSLTYAELCSRADALSNYLRAHGVGPEQKAAVLCRRGLDFVVAELAVMRSGGAFVPVDPEYPVDRIRYMLEDSKARVVVYHKSLEQLVPTDLAVPAGERPEPGERVIKNVPVARFCIDRDWVKVKTVSGVSGSESRLQLRRTPYNMVYTLYTSGSTGKPKGVVIQHASLLNYVDWHVGLFKLGPGVNTTQASGPAFDASVLEVWPALCSGATLHIVDNETRLDPQALSRFLVERQVTVAFFTTPIAEMLIRDSATWDHATHPLRTLMCGGDKLHLAPPPGSNYSLYNLYGPTENTIVATAHRVAAAEDAADPPIGKPIANVKCYILDRKSLHPVPVGVPGELYIGGASLARGYHGREDLTSAAFVRNPFSRNPAARLYKTGDLCRYRPDGAIVFEGRVDSQVKIRGFRVELGEIETLLSAEREIAECIVIVREDVPGEKRIVAYVTVKDQFKCTPQTLRAALKNKLPYYMLPSAYVIMDHLPLTPNGKVDRRALPLPVEDDAAHADGAKAASVAPRNAVEEQIARIWKELLSCDVGSVYDNFFDLGGHSLTATSLLSRVRQTFGVDIGITVFFDRPTVAALAELVASAAAAAAGGGGGAGASAHAEAEVDLGAEVQLDPSICLGPSLLPEVPPSAWRTVLLTGSTGFLGAFILAEILEQRPGVRVVCIVRAKDPEDAAKRVLKNLAYYQLLKPGYEARIVGMCGDLAKPRDFGVGADNWRVLVQECDAIFHNGSLVNFLYSYQALRAANVLSTHLMLQLATTHRLKRVFYVSTLSVYPPGFADVIVEDHVPDAWKGLLGGYSQTKWVSDALFRLAHEERGVPVTVFRPGRITGNEVNGISSLEDFMFRLLKGCRQLGVAPVVDWQVDLTPASWVAWALVRLSLEESAVGEAYHLTSPHPMPWLDVVGYMASRGYAIRAIPYDEWLARLRSDCETSTMNSLYPLISTFHEGLDKEKIPVFKIPGTLKAIEALQGERRQCPPVDKTLLDVYWDYFEKVGFMSPKE
jgi:amino acid adenylation domain-containing protein/thioester reductase-like protein